MPPTSQLFAQIFENFKNFFHLKMIKKKIIINPASHNRKTKQAYFLFFPPPPPTSPPPPLQLDRKILVSVSSSWKRGCVANNTSLWRESERASVRKRGGGEWKRLEKGGNVFRDLQTGRGDAGRRFRGWILGPRGWAEAGERLLKPGRGTDSTTYIRFLPPPPPLFLSLPQWRNRDREPPCHVGLGQFREELPNCLQLLQAREQWAKRGGIGRRRTARDP